MSDPVLMAVLVIALDSPRAAPTQSRAGSSGLASGSKQPTSRPWESSRM